MYMPLLKRKLPEGETQQRFQVSLFRASFLERIVWNRYK
jgi:hypothetical protein